MKPNPREMTVARLRQARDADGVDVTFVESARFYRLANGTRDFDRLLGLRNARVMPAAASG